MYKLKTNFLLETIDNKDLLATINFLENNGFEYLSKEIIDKSYISSEEYLYIYVKDDALKDFENNLKYKNINTFSILKLTQNGVVLYSAGPYHDGTIFIPMSNISLISHAPTTTEQLKNV